jgi:protein TonB
MRLLAFALCLSAGAQSVPPQALGVRPAPSPARPPSGSRARVDEAGRLLPNRVRVRPEQMAQLLLRRVEPDYPPLARHVRVQGVVRFGVLIGRDGHVRRTKYIGGPPLLARSAMLALLRYVYEPVLLKGQPIEVVTTVKVIFKRDALRDELLAQATGR